MSRELFRSVVRGLTRSGAATSPQATDPRLQGRTYAIPFDEVWQASLQLIDGGLNRWELLEADDESGTLRGRAHGWLDRFTGDVTVHITLDADAQTRVDAIAASRQVRGDLGSNARRLHLYFTALDRALEQRRGKPIDSLRLEPDLHEHG